MFIVKVNYECKEGQAKAFVAKAKELRIDVTSRSEEGNLCYEYSYDVENSNVVHLLEMWKDQAAIDSHMLSAHYAKLGELKAEFVEKTVFEKFESTKL